MKIRTIWLAAVALFLFAASSTHGQGRFELDPFVGYETTASYPVTTSSGSPAAPIDQLRVNGATAFGGFIDYSLTENFQPEFMWNRNNTSYSAHDPFTNSYISGYHSVIDQFQFGGLYMFRSSEVKLRPYVAASIGFTHDENGNNTPNRTEFSYQPRRRCEILRESSHRLARRPSVLADVWKFIERALLRSVFRLLLCERVPLPEPRQLHGWDHLQVLTKRVRRCR